MLTGNSDARGVTLIELAITLAILGLLLVLGMPSYRTWVQNVQLRTAGESLLAGLQMARNEAVSRNTSVRFQLVDSLGATCGLVTPGSAAVGTSWVVSVDDAVAHCNGDSTAAPWILQKKPAGEGTANVSITPAHAAIVFSALGQVTDPPVATAIDLANPSGGTCIGTAGGTMRCLRVQVGPGGQARLCDPQVAPGVDPRAC